MLIPRIIPCLLLQGAGLVKTIKFKNEKYIGDPVNAIKIFNEKGADELIFLDIMASIENRKPDFALISQVAAECFMPVCYGGGIKEIDDAKRIFNSGIEKISLGSGAIEKPEFIRELVRIFGSQSIVACLDVKKNLLGNYEVVIHRARKKTGLEPWAAAKKMQDMGVGELLINSVDRDGTMSGYDLGLMQKITKNISIPVIACGGAGNLKHIAEVINEGGASSGAAGSLFVFHSKRRGVLINYPDREQIDSLFKRMEHA
ncbi:MAG: AglZ/HisF2 family acetamidino modification protein [Candidatus Omnitrophota bacterium]|jgi:cyclase